MYTARTVRGLVSGVIMSNAPGGDGTPCEEPGRSCLSCVAICERYVYARARVCVSVCLLTTAVPTQLRQPVMSLCSPPFPPSPTQQAQSVARFQE